MKTFGKIKSSKMFFIEEHGECDTGFFSRNVKQTLINWLESSKAKTRYRPYKPAQYTFLTPA